MSVSAIDLSQRFSAVNEIVARPYFVTHDPFLRNLHLHVFEKVIGLKGAPSVPLESLPLFKEQMLEDWRELLAKGYLQLNGDFEECKNRYGLLYVILEMAIINAVVDTGAKGEGVICQERPPLIFCTKNFEPPRAFWDTPTRASRSKAYLNKEGYLVSVYTKKRIPEEMAVYAETLETHPGKLFDKPLTCEKIPEAMTGSHYRCAVNGEEYGVALRVLQPSVSTPPARCLWFGKMDAFSEITCRINEVLSFIKENSSSK